MVITGFFVFFVCSVMGWFWEVLLNIVCCGCFVNRGMLYGPWIPIYGFGALMVLFIVLNVNTPWQIFVICAATCGLLEYITSYVMEVLWQMRWWNYTGIFSVHGRIDLLVIMVFGAIGLFFYYVVVPALPWIRNAIAMPSRRILLVFMGILLVDFIYSQINPNVASISNHHPF